MTEGQFPSPCWVDSKEKLSNRKLKKVAFVGRLCLSTDFTSALRKTLRLTHVSRCNEKNINFGVRPALGLNSDPIMWLLGDCGLVRSSL